MNFSHVGLVMLQIIPKTKKTVSEVVVIVQLTPMVMVLPQENTWHKNNSVNYVSTKLTLISGGNTWKILTSIAQDLNLMTNVELKEWLMQELIITKFNLVSPNLISNLQLKKELYNKIHYQINNYQFLYCLELSYGQLLLLIMLLIKEVQMHPILWKFYVIQSMNHQLDVNLMLMEKLLLLILLTETLKNQILPLLLLLLLLY